MTFSLYVKPVKYFMFLWIEVIGLVYGLGWTSLLENSLISKYYGGSTTRIQLDNEKQVSRKLKKFKAKAFKPDFFRY